MILLIERLMLDLVLLEYLKNIGDVKYKTKFLKNVWSYIFFSLQYIACEWSLMYPL